MESAAWMARDVRYLDDPTADPPNKTLAHLSPRSVLIWAVIYSKPEASKRTVPLELSSARALPCCDAEGVPAGEWELSGSGGRGYSVIIRVYFGSRPTAALRAEAQQALNQLELPPAR
jgi:hypothetical protein